ncbi:unnamed protein product [Rotaria sp. Silwood1]|nr:unnamed protein product [Rotaria sp. Silwood1]CAF1638805.1 unnamed protein product [Rotaria sp. Silwood1]
MLSHDTLHSKQVINIQDLIKHYDSLLASGHEPETHVIVNSIQIEDDKWKRLSRQIVDLLLAHLQSQDQSLLDIYSTQLTLFDVVSSVELRSIDPFVIAFRALNDVLLSVNGTRDETFSAALLRILHDVILRILTNTRQLCGQINMTLVSLVSDYLYTRLTLDTSSNNSFTDIEWLGTRDLLSYGQLSYDTILTSIQSNNTLPLSVNISLTYVLIIDK